MRWPVGACLQDRARPLGRANRRIEPPDSVRFPAVAETERQSRASLVGLRRLGARWQGASCTSDDTGVLTIGSAEDNALVVSVPSVSRYHVEVRATPEGIAIEDLGSTNGTFRGDVRIVRAIVPAPVELRLGDTVITIEEGEPIARAPTEDAPPAIPGLVAVSAAMSDVARRIAQVAPSGASVLVRGETGTGKEVVARAIHDLSPRADRAFEVVDCGSLPPTLIASELFGHERGAFTGADRKRIGAFERAHGGTLFLDEIGELPLDVQPALLGALERRRFRPLGASREVDVDVRVIAATHRDLRAAVNDASFRADLYYRIAVTRIEIAPLRERPEDIEALVAHFVREVRDPSAPSPFGWAAMAALREHRWAGNARELRNVVESALAMGRIELDGAPSAELAGDDARASYRDARALAVERFERAFLTELMAEAAGNASEAARRARMDRPYLLTLLRKHGLR
ncbi:MAG: sigma 54-dependent Fis family transcriptional regulator [Myxococcota bacterium]|nr:sigma 54-dependent Fis family transcriptional regulator [Myxococcota bacterium]